VDHPVALFGGMHHTGLGKVHPLAVVLHALGEAAQMARVIPKVKRYDAYVFVDDSALVHSSLLEFEVYKKSPVNLLRIAVNGF
jgi:hypothetical protein